MKNKVFRILLSSVMGCLFYLFFGWFVFEFLLGSYIESNTTQIVGFKKNESESNIAMLIISCFAYSTLLSIILGYWANIRNFKKGTSSGAIIGILVAVMTNCYWYSTSHYYTSILPLLVDVGAAGITVGLTGGIISWVYNIKKITY